MILAVLVGATTGLAAVFFIRLIAFIQHFSYTNLQSFLPSMGSLAFVFVPVLGALIVIVLIFTIGLTLFLLRSIRWQGG